MEEQLELRFIGATCVGAAARLVGVISRNCLEQAIREELATLGKAVVEENMKKGLSGYDRMADHTGSVKEGGDVAVGCYEKPEWVDLPFEDAGISAPAIHGAATSETMKTGLWRTMRPVIDYDRCRRCWWVCSTMCPDSAISVDEEGYPRIDYEHCKGCMVCASQCSRHAIRTVPEHEAEDEPEKGEGS